VSFSYHTLSITTCSFVLLWVLCTSYPLSNTLLHLAKDNQHGLSNSSWFKLVPYGWKERDEVYQCIIPIRSWILGIKKLLVRLQNLCDDDLYVWQGFFQQLMTTFKKQFMASTPIKSKVQNLTLEVVQLSIGIGMSK